MEEQNIQAIAALQSAKEKGLSYFDAIQNLKAQGFSQEVINSASDGFDYVLPNSASADAEKQLEQREIDEQDDEKAQEQQDRMDRMDRGFEHFGRL